MVTPSNHEYQFRIARIAKMSSPHRGTAGTSQQIPACGGSKLPVLSYTSSGKVLFSETYQAFLSSLRLPNIPAGALNAYADSAGKAKSKRRASASPHPHVMPCWHTGEHQGDDGVRLSLPVRVKVSDAPSAVCVEHITLTDNRTALIAPLMVSSLSPISQNMCYAALMTKAFAYLRVSGKSQLIGDGFDRQELTIKAFATSQQIEIVATAREEGVSGTVDGMDRPTWARLIADIMRDGSVSTILVERLDRLARDLMVQEVIIADLKSRRITLISAVEPDLCIDDPTRKLMRQIMGAIAEYDKTMLVSKMRGARERKRGRGERCEGRKPYGTRPNEQLTLGLIRQLNSANMNPTSIANYLNKRNLLTRSGTTWHPFTVARILKRLPWDET